MGRLSQASPTPPYLKRGLHAKPPSLPDPTLKPSYSQVVKTKIPPRDPEKWARDFGKGTCDVSRDPGKGTRDVSRDPGKGTRDVSRDPGKGTRDVSCDPGKGTRDVSRDPGKGTRDVSRDPLPVLVTHDQTRDYTRARDPARSRDPTCFGCATRPLIGTWKTMGINQRSTRSQGIPHSLSPMDTGTGNTLIGLRA